MRLAVLILVLAGMTGCDRARDLGPPRAVAVRADGALELALTTLNLCRTWIASFCRFDFDVGRLSFHDATDAKRNDS